MSDTARVQLAAGTGSAAAVVPTPLLRLIGFSITETTGVPAVSSVSIQEGTGTDLTKEICAISLAASESRTIWLGENGVPCPGGIWVNRTSGTTRVTIHYRVSDKDKDSFAPPYW